MEKKLTAPELEVLLAWLWRAELRAEPVRDEVIVVLKVVSAVVLSEVTVETTSLVTVVWGTEVAPATPEMPEMVVVPVVVPVESPLVQVEVNSLVVMAVAAPPAPAPSEEASEVTALEGIVLTSEVTVAVGTPGMEPPAPVPYVDVSDGLRLSHEMRKLTAAAGKRLRSTPASAHHVLAQLMVVSASLSEQTAMEQSRTP